MPLDSQQNNPPSIRTNADGRITNIDDIREHLGSYSDEEINEMKWVIRAALTKAAWDLMILERDFAAHENGPARGLLMKIQAIRKINAEGKFPESWNSTELTKSLQETVGNILADSTTLLLALDDQKRYAENLNTLGEEILAEIHRRKEPFYE
jgi:hypothetical protein